MSYHRAVLWVHGNLVRLQMRSGAGLDVRFSVDGKERLTRRLAQPVVSIPLQLGKPGWHLVTLDTGALPHVGGRKEGARLLSYVLG